MKHRKESLTSEQANVTFDHSIGFESIDASKSLSTVNNGCLIAI
ncbi:hypothetical protein [Pandoraea cepalis]|uniref:Uncharacterized protein n=1 Tax=Pandoraea cepalis TaxID=2508294 RepID=A0A5E4W0Y6_9BURK|nr:hypothetical protein [Pandoraea cepalis]VVE16940.1 hypothetical protein PCE31107_02944 [Pandoraea cepalis]